MIHPPILSLLYKNVVSNIPETPLQIGDFVEVVLGDFKDYYENVTGLCYLDEIELKYFKKRDRYYVIVKMT